MKWQLHQLDARDWAKVIGVGFKSPPAARRFTHNHPSGDPTPSQADVRMTKAIIDIAAPLGIAVRDHIIVGRGGHASLKGMGLI